MPQNTISDFERKLAFHTTPAMLGIKPANLISLDENGGCLDSCVDIFNRKAASKGLKIRELSSVRGRKLLLVYNEKNLAKQLEKDSVREMFREFGYSGMNVEQSIERLSERISESGDFPHEIGLFLGYPVEDVRGFIDNKGENYLFCGYWKVYSDEKRARRMFSNYSKCRSYIIGRLDSGEDFYRALHIC